MMFHPRRLIENYKKNEIYICGIRRVGIKIKPKILIAFARKKKKTKKVM